MNISSPVIGGLLASIFAVSSTHAQTLKSVPNDMPQLSSAVTALHWTGEQERFLHAGTLSGEVVTWHVPDLSNIAFRERGRYQADRFAVFCLLGHGRRIVTGGLAADPKLTTLPGSRLGVVAGIEQIRATAVNPRARRVAALRDDQVLLIDKLDRPNSPRSIAGRFTHLTWVETTAAEWLVTTADDGTVAFHNGNQVKVAQLPLGIKPTCLTRGVTENQVAVGDDRGFVRILSIPDQTQTDAPAELAAFARDGSAVATYHAGKLRIRSLSGGLEPPEIAAAVKPSLLAVTRLNEKLVSATATVVNGTWKVNRFDSNGLGTPLLPQVADLPSPKGLRLHPSGNQVAAWRADGVVFYEKLQPTDAMDEFPQDTQIVAAEYSPTGHWLAAVGADFSLYSTVTRELATKPLKLTPPNGGSVVAADLEWSGGDKNTPPDEATLLLCWSSGDLQRVKVAIAPANPPAQPVPALAAELISSTKEDWVATASIALLHGFRIYVGREKTVQCWSQAEKDLVAFERFEAEEKLLGLAANEKVLMRQTTTMQLRSQPTVTDAVKGEDAAVTHLLHLKSRHWIALAGKQLLSRTFAPGDLKRSDLNAKCTALAIDEDAAALVTATDKEEASDLQLWSLADGVPTNPQVVAKSATPVTSVEFVLGSPGFVTAEENGALRRWFPFQATSPNYDGEDWEPHTSAVVALHRVPLSAAASERGRDPFLVLDQEGKWSVYTPQHAPQISLETPAVQPFPRSPWYAIAKTPNVKPQATLVAADGRAWRTPELTNQPGLAGLMPKLAPLVLQPEVVVAATDRPLYAATWSLTVLHGTPPKPSLFVGGADGDFYRREGAAWTRIVAKNPGSTTAALASDPERAILAVGYDAAGTNGASGLMVWPKSLKADEAQLWPGHASGVRAVAFSPDGQRLVSADQEGHCRLWDCSELTETEVNAPAFVEADLKSPASAVAWLTNTKYFAVGLVNGKILIYEAD